MNLLENVLTFTLLSIALVAIIGMLNTGTLLGARSENQVHADRILQELQEFYGLELRTVADGSYTLSTRLGPNGVEFRPTLNLTTPVTDPKAPVRRLETVVDWTYRQRAYRQNRTRLLCPIPR